jgi:hypothetical protein
MRHCADLYAQECIDGDVLVVSLRKPNRVRPAATARYCKHSSGWKLKQVVGRANSPAPDVAWAAAAEIERYLDQWQPAEEAA